MILANKTVKFRILFAFLTIIVIFFVWYFVSIYFNRYQAVKAVGAMPYQIGLKNTQQIKCAPSCCAPTCTCCAGYGGIPDELCATKTPVDCPLYTHVYGVPSGGMGRDALFSVPAISVSGLTPGGELIGGGMSPVAMDNGVLASAGGCYGCYARIESADKIKNFFDKVYIAIFGE
ncbi:MAG: hypothetical protein MUC28_04025 [Planctomycetes bacterium]|jgi:hypothetical protein|nr:hypothetical protein [Planctomycetota bacterium]